MIERLNFFDLYGYIIPGAVLFLMIWIPCGLLTGSWGPGDIPDVIGTVAAIVAAYVVGFVMQQVAEDVLPSKSWEEKAKRWRYPSEQMLDAMAKTFSPDFLKLLREMMQKRFHFGPCDLPVEDTNGTLSKEQREAREKGARDEVKRREDLFRLCRTELVQHGKSSYVEQYQGMYTLCRGTALALFIASFLYLGGGVRLLLGANAPRALDWIAIVVIAAAGVVSVLAQYRRFLEKVGERETRRESQTPRIETVLPGLLHRVWGPVAVTMLAIGFFAGACVADSCTFPRQCGAVLVALIPVVWSFGLAFRSSHVHFAGQFAAAVYRDFVALDDRKIEDKKAN